MTKPQDPIEPLTATLPQQAHGHGGLCENCRTALQGGYCHVCGQHAHNPLRSFKHAVEDVFESFWHVDGRIFRTLRDLLMPGRITNEYLGGKRVRYIPPLRLYVILSLITFFVAHFVAAGVKTSIDLNVKGNAQSNAFYDLMTVEAVEARRNEMVTQMQADMKKAASVPGAATGIGIGIEKINEQADRRVAELQGKSLPVQSEAAPKVQIFGSTEHDPKTFLGGIGQRWQKNAEANVRTFAKEPGKGVERLLSHVPTTLFVLVPLFALLLRFVYLLRPMGYLEHLVVALYSHSFLLLAALAWMLLVLLDRALGTTALSSLGGGLFWLGVPVYLLFSQKRIYRDGWPMTLLRWVIIGTSYSIFAAFALVAASAMTLVGNA